MYKITLVDMPFADIKLPSIALTQIKIGNSISVTGKSLN